MNEEHPAGRASHTAHDLTLDKTVLEVQGEPVSVESLSKIECLKYRNAVVSKIVERTISSTGTGR